MLVVSPLLLALVASAPQPGQPLLRAEMTKSLDAFGACFTRVQEKAARAWAFMPSGKGGTFTNSGASESDASYWLQIRTTGPSGEIRLVGTDGAQPPAALIEAVNRCR